MEFQKSDRYDLGIEKFEKREIVEGKMGILSWIFLRAEEKEGS